MANVNSQIVYDAARNLKTGFNIGDEVVLGVLLTSLDGGHDVDNKSARSLSGKKKTTLMWYARRWSVELAMVPDDGIDQTDVDMFIDSTIGEETFSIYIIDDQEFVDVRRVGGYSKRRRSSHITGAWDYSFRIEEVL